MHVFIIGEFREQNHTAIAARLRSWFEDRGDRSPNLIQI